MGQAGGSQGAQCKGHPVADRHEPGCSSVLCSAVALASYLEMKWGQSGMFGGGGAFHLCHLGIMAAAVV